VINLAMEKRHYNNYRKLDRRKLDNHAGKNIEKLIIIENY
jgi:hypothetical protein